LGIQKEREQTVTTVASKAGNLGAIIQYIFFASGTGEDPEKDSAYRSAERFVGEAQSVLALTERGKTRFRQYLYNCQDGHELQWIKAHEAEVVILSVGHCPDSNGASVIWRDALEKLEQLESRLEATEPRELQGKARAFVGRGGVRELTPTAQTLTRLPQPWNLSAQSAWGSVRAPGASGPFLVAVDPEYLPEGEQFISWEILGYALYASSKGMHQWQDYLAQREAMEKKDALIERLIDEAYDSSKDDPEHADKERLKRLVDAGRANSEIQKNVSRASVAIKKARLNLQRVLQGVFTTDRGLVAGMKSNLLDCEEILAAEAAIQQERSAELDRMTQQYQREMHLETSRRSEMLLAAAHAVEFIVVLYYSLAAWGLVIGKHAQEETIHPLGKLLWGLLVSGAAVFATSFVLKQWGERWALSLLLVVIVLAVVFAGLLQWGWVPTAH
jgi:hypothetical protein